MKEVLKENGGALCVHVLCVCFDATDWSKTAAVAAAAAN